MMMMMTKDMMVTMMQMDGGNDDGGDGNCKRDCDVYCGGDLAVGDTVPFSPREEAGV